MDARELPPSCREQEVLRQLARGHTLKEIAVKLDVSAKTVETYKHRGLRKLNLKSRADLVRFAADRGWLGSKADGLLDGLLASKHEARLKFFLDGLCKDENWTSQQICRLEEIIRTLMRERDASEVLPFRTAAAPAS